MTPITINAVYFFAALAVMSAVGYLRGRHDACVSIRRALDASRLAELIAHAEAMARRRG